MKAAFVGLLLAVCSYAQTSPTGAEFRTLEITYRLQASGRLSETQQGELALYDSPLLNEFRRLAIPRRNSAGDVRVDSLQLVRVGQTTPIMVAVEKTPEFFIWDVAEAQASDVVRFRVEQPVDPTAEGIGGWWYVNSAQASLPIRDGVVQLLLPEGFKGSVARADEKTLGDDYRWALGGVKGADAIARFTLSSFSDWSGVAQWVSSKCRPTIGPAITQLASQIRGAETQAGARVATAIRAVQQRIAASTETHASVSCRPLDAVLESGTGSGTELQMVLAALLQALGTPAERVLTGREDLASATPDPEAFTGELLRLNVGGKLRWVDARHLENGLTGLPLSRAGEISLPLLDTPGPERIAWSTPLVRIPGAEIDTASLSAELEGTSADSGLLYVSLRASATGALSQEFEGGSGKQPFASFVKDLPVRSASSSMASPSTSNSEFVAHKADFFSTVERRLQTPLNVVELMREPLAMSDGSLILGAPGSYRESIRFAVPSNRILAGTQRTEIEKPYARYRSESRLEGNVLMVTRELEIVAPLVSPTLASEAKVMWSQIQKDQNRKFTLTRTGQVDWNALASSLPPYQLLTTGWKLYRDNQDYDGALILLDRAIQANQAQAKYWKSQVLSAVGRWDDAIQALEEQIQADPKYQIAYTALASMYMTREQTDKAADVLHRWLISNPSDRAVRAGLVRSYLAGGKAAEAEEAATNLTLPAPLDRYLNIDRTTARVCQGKAGKADLETAWMRPAPNDLDGVAKNLLACNADPELIRDLLTQGLELVRPFVDLRTNDLRSVFAAQFAHARLLTQRGRLYLRTGNTAGGIADLRASVNMTQNPQTMAILAQALWQSGNREEAFQLWADATATGMVSIESVPQEARLSLPNAKLVEQNWYEAAKLPLNPLPPGDLEPHYYYVCAKEDGSVDRVRDLNPEPSPGDALTAVRRLMFPPLIVDGKELPTAHVVRLTADPSGSATLFHSNSENTFVRMTTLAPANFPVQPAAAAAGAAARAAESSANQQ